MLYLNTKEIQRREEIISVMIKGNETYQSFFTSAITAAVCL